MWKLPVISKQILKARAAHIMATIDMPYPYRDLVTHYHRYTISEWRWFLEYSPVILAPYVDKSGQEVRRSCDCSVIVRAFCLPQAPPVLKPVLTIAAARDPTCACCFRQRC